MARDPLEKETDVFNQMTQTVALNNQIMKNLGGVPVKSLLKSAPAKAVVKKKSAGPMPKVVQKKAPPAPGGSRPYKGNAAPGGSTRTVSKGVPAPGASMRPKAAVPGGSTRPRYSGTPVPGTSSPYRSQAAKDAAKPAAKPAAKKSDYSNESNAAYMLRSLGKALTSKRETGYSNTIKKGATRTTAGIAGKSAKSVNQLFK